MNDEYPIILYRDTAFFGSTSTFDPHAIRFTVTDFPLSRRGDQWSGFPNQWVVQPVSSRPITESDYRFPKQIDRTDMPDRLRYHELLLQIQKHEAEKTVFARMTTLTFFETLDPIGIFHYLKNRCVGSLPFAFILSPELAFVGATPELLFRRQGRTLSTMALAGTRTHDKESELLSSSKELAEFGLVKQDIARKLELFCEPFSVTDDHFIHRTANLSHLYYPFEATLRSDITDAMIQETLHPTPAIAGLPRKSSLEAIGQFEPFDRGWYAGTFGYTFGNTTEIHVALRCAQVKQNKLHVFAGGGIMKQSIPEQEWQELDNKMKLFGVT